MPNWTENTVTISGDTHTIDTIIEKITLEDKVALTELMPMPKEIQATHSGTFIYTYVDENGEAFDFKREDETIGQLSSDELAKVIKENKLTKVYLEPIKEEDIERFSLKEEKYIVDTDRSDRYIMEYGANNWYNWQILQWGTKWGDCETVIEEVKLHADKKGKTMTLHFVSPWSSPHNLLDYISWKYKVKINSQFIHEFEEEMYEDSFPKDEEQ